MALPTVHYDEAAAASDSALISVWMPALHALLIAAGWTQSYIDSDGIGGGSSGSPAWDKNPANNTDAGIVVYRMPANDHSVQWFVRLRPGWSGATTRVCIRGVTVGTSHDGSGNVTGQGDEITPTVNTTTATNSRAWQIAVSEDGFLFVNSGTTNPVAVYVERLRNPAGAVTDDICVLTCYFGQEYRVVNASSGVLTTTSPLTLAGVTHVTTPTATVGVTTSIDGEHVVVLGPYWRGALPLYGAPRLMFYASPNEVSGNDERERPIDGGDKTYKAWATNTNASLCLMVATE